MRCKHRVASAKSNKKAVLFATGGLLNPKVNTQADVQHDDDNDSQSIELESPIRYLMDARKRLREVFNQLNEALEVECHYYKKVKSQQGFSQLTLKPLLLRALYIHKRR